MINWTSKESSILFNPSYSEKEIKIFNRILENSQDLPSHLWLSTSGSTSKKWVGISKTALLCSAEAVNTHLQSTKLDRWGLVLPEFHVGGVGIRARGFLSQAQVFDFKQISLKWNPALFYEFLKSYQITLTALVPTQLFDLIQLDFSAPSQLRAIIVGGGHLSTNLLQQAIKKGWKILQSYGLTECGSQVATACLDKPFSLKILPHIKVKLIQDRLAFSGNSLLTCYAHITKEEQIEFIDPKVESWFLSQDRGIVENHFLFPLGRVDDCIKIMGESVDLAKLESTLQFLKIEEKLSNQMTLQPIRDSRIGYRLHLVIEGEKNIDLEQKILSKFHKLVLPFERIKEVSWLKSIPTSSLGKVLKKDLTALIEMSSR